MPTEFPRLKTGAVTQYPAESGVQRRTVVRRFLDGSEQRFPELRGVSRRWVVRLRQLTPEEAREIALFFEDRQGRYGEFSFVDPDSGVTYEGCRFEDDNSAWSAEGENDHSMTLVIRKDGL